MVPLRFGSCVLAAAALTVSSPPRLAAQPPIRGEITNLRASVVGPGTVEIRYDLGTPRGGLAFDVSIVASEDGGVTFPIKLSSVSGDVGAAIMPGTDKRVVWNAARDVERAAFDRFLYQVTATALPPAAPPRPSGNANSPAPAQSRGGGGTKWLLIGGGVAAAGAAAALAGGGGAATPSAAAPPLPTRAVVTATVVPNPVPFSGSPISHPRCVNSRNTWAYLVTLTETAGVAARFDRVVDRFNAVIANDLQQTYHVSARGSTNIQYSWCSDASPPHLVETTLSGVDANGNSISTTVPPVTLLGRGASSSNSALAFRRPGQGAGGPHRW